MTTLAALFGLTALLYAAVGFGGGSTYTALLLLGGVAVGLVPAITLACNVVVVTGGTIRFARAGLMPWAKALPLIVVAAPLLSDLALRFGPPEMFALMVFATTLLMALAGDSLVKALMMGALVAFQLRR